MSPRTSRSHATRTATSSENANGTPRIKGGFTLSRALQTTVLSLTALRRLRFPLNGGADSHRKVDDAARTVLAALGLLGATLAREEGADLRSRCQLFPSQRFVWELLDAPSEVPKPYALTGNEAVAIFNAAVSEAKGAGLPWDGDIVLSLPMILLSSSRGARS